HRGQFRLGLFPFLPGRGQFLRPGGELPLVPPQHLAQQVGPLLGHLGRLHPRPLLLRRPTLVGLQLAPRRGPLLLDARPPRLHLRRPPPPPPPPRPAASTRATVPPPTGGGSPSRPPTWTTPRTGTGRGRRRRSPPPARPACTPRRTRPAWPIPAATAPA